MFFVKHAPPSEVFTLGTDESVNVLESFSWKYSIYLFMCWLINAEALCNHTSGRGGGGGGGLQIPPPQKKDKKKCYIKCCFKWCKVGGGGVLLHKNTKSLATEPHPLPKCYLSNRWLR